MPSLSEHLAVLMEPETRKAFRWQREAWRALSWERLRAGTGHLRWLMRQKQLRELCS